MITIITGKKGSGKTTFIEQWYAQERVGVGCITKKVYISDKWIGYDLLLLPSHQSIPFIRLLAYKDTLPDSNLLYFNRFAFSQQAFQKAEQLLKNAILAGDAPIWIDEIGNQELADNGFATVLREAIDKGVELRIVFRQHRFFDLLKHFKITDYKQINCKT